LVSTFQIERSRGKKKKKNQKKFSEISALKKLEKESGPMNQSRPPVGFNEITALRFQKRFRRVQMVSCPAQAGRKLGGRKSMVRAPKTALIWNSSDSREKGRQYSKTHAKFVCRFRHKRPQLLLSLTSAGFYPDGNFPG